MTTKIIELLFLNVGDVIEISVENFYYKLTKKEKKTVVEFEEKKTNEKGWIPCPIITGSYCGNNYSSNSNYKELNIIKIRASKPFNMGNAYHAYLTFAPSQITGIAIIKKKEGKIFDKIGHTLTMEEDLDEN